MINGAAARKTRGSVRTVKSGALRGTWSADFIRASGHRTAQTGRTHDRIPQRSKSPKITLASKGPSTHDTAARQAGVLNFVGVWSVYDFKASSPTEPIAASGSDIPRRP